MKNQTIYLIISFLFFLSVLDLPASSRPKSNFVLEKKKLILQDKNYKIKISIKQQTLYLISKNEVLKKYPVSTSKYGIGSESGSNKTPLGKHEIRDKIGHGADEGTIFKSRINTGKKARILSSPVDVEEDFVTTRIMRLAGLEKGKNKGAGISSYHRYIYIHGTPEEGLIGRPASHGCIRMKNKDVIEIFELVEEGTKVIITK